MSVMRIVTEGENHCGDRLITIEIPRDSNLYKYEPEYLPLFAGYSWPSGGTVQAGDLHAIRPDRLKQGESIKDYLFRLKEYSQKLAILDQWFLTMRSRTPEEDRTILGQVAMLNGMEFDHFQSVILRGTFDYFPETGDSIGESDMTFSESKQIKAILKSLTDDPTQMGPGALMEQHPGKAGTGLKLGQVMPKELDGFGITINTWNYATVRAAWVNGQFIWHETIFSDEEQEPLSLANPIFFAQLDDAKAAARK